jgi:hypothetical protein
VQLPSERVRAPARTIRLQQTRGFGRVLAPSELWRFRELALQIAVRDITVRYRQTVLRALWTVLQPVAAVVVFSIFFGKLARLSSEGHAYVLFSLAGLVPWTFFSNGPLLGSRRRRAVPEVIDKAAVLCVRLARKHPLPGFRSTTGCTATRCRGSRRNRDLGDVINVEAPRARCSLSAREKIGAKLPARRLR